MKTTLCTMALVLLCCAASASAQAPVADYFSTTSTLDGKTLPVGSLIEAFDGDDVRCGVAETLADGRFLIHVYGNDPMTPEIDEGAREGEVLRWRIAGYDAATTEWVSNIIGLFADLRFENGAAKEIHLEAATGQMSVKESTWAEVKRVYRP